MLINFPPPTRPRFQNPVECLSFYCIVVSAFKDCELITILSYCLALILEEIAIDSHNKELEAQMLHNAQELHLQSLELAKKAFGENNVQTAKHYGNLGRLYQSMQKFKVTRH